MKPRPNPDRWQRVYAENVKAGRTDQEAADAADADRMIRFRITTRKETNR